MPTAIKLSDALAEDARAASAGADRSLTGQVEHWARIGKAVEPLFNATTIAVLKKSGGDLSALEDERERARIIGILDAFHGTSREALREKLNLASKPLIEPDPDIPGGFIRFNPDGTSQKGHLQGREFVPS
jgi:hypothetical protein